MRAPSNFAPKSLGIRQKLSRTRKSPATEVASGVTKDIYTIRVINFCFQTS